MEGIVIKKLSNDFWVKVGNEVKKCKPRGNLKSSGIYVGDSVEIEEAQSTIVITKVNERANILIRPPIANLSQLIIVVSPIPKPDFLIVDKLILFAYSHGIKPIIVINKQDISNELNDYIKFAYSSFVDVVFVSAKSGENINKLQDILKGHISAFAGQSAVGKSALINILFNNSKAIEGTLSKKINRGKNTTRHSEIYYNDDIMIADTSGFTSLDETLLPIPYYELPFYYLDYNVYKNQCKYTSCTHINEPYKDCKIKQLVKENKLDENRYERDKKIYDILDTQWVKPHG